LFILPGPAHGKSQPVLLHTFIVEFIFVCVKLPGGLLKNKAIPTNRCLLPSMALFSTYLPYLLLVDFCPDLV